MSIFSRFSTTLVFPVEGFGVILCGDFGSPSALWGPKNLLAPLRGAEALRAIRVPNRRGLTAAQQPPAGPEQLGALVQSAQRGTSRGRRRPADRGCAAEPLRRLTGALSRPACNPSRHAGAAHLQRDAITLCRKAPQSSPSRPTRPCHTKGAQLKVGVSALRPWRVWVTGWSAAHERCATRPALGRPR